MAKKDRMQEWNSKIKELDEFKEKGQISYKEYKKKRKKLDSQRPLSAGGKIGVAIVMAIILMFIIAVFIGASNSLSDNALISQKVSQELNKLSPSMRSDLASTRPDGYRGDITKVEPAIGSNSVKVYVSTYFKDSGNTIDGGQSIANTIFSTICSDIPELDSLYVISESSGLESQSVYRSQTPACKTRSEMSQ